ncbi:Delta(12) oleic acid desaturase FAD2 [Ananas comosus]|uniref:Delta(12) oleic acid desaturase FAD2 n=1 Tax=Ananas comosus TaxID=4615 RepID=A0A199V0X1_ANACO|nr:Delta(12) oleic acid desaturase FAD2 [Ananas comosus]
MSDPRIASLTGSSERASKSMTRVHLGDCGGAGDKFDAVVGATTGEMGAGGRMTAKERAEQRRDAARGPGSGGAGDAAALRRSPTEKPPFTLGQIKKAIPAHCFQRSVLRSFSYVVHDLGCVLTGVWVVAHECGTTRSPTTPSSTTPSPRPPLALLVPTSPGSTATAATTPTRLRGARRGVRPQDQASLRWYSATSATTRSAASPVSSSSSPSLALYLAFNVSAALPALRCHYDPYGPIYSDRERAQIFVSDAGVLAACFALYRLAAALACVGLAPRRARHHGPRLRAAERVFHHITDTHVATTSSHHAHYHAWRPPGPSSPSSATTTSSTHPVLQAMWREARECVYVEPEDGANRKGVLWYNNKF